QPERGVLPQSSPQEWPTGQALRAAPEPSGSTERASPEQTVQPERPARSPELAHFGPARTAWLEHSESEQAAWPGLPAPLPALSEMLPPPPPSPAWPLRLPLRETLLPANSLLIFHASIA